MPLLAAALRCGPRDTATAAFILSCFAVWGTPPAEHGGIEPPGYRSRMGDAQAQLGLEQLRRMAKLNAARVATVLAYEAALRERGVIS